MKMATGWMLMIAGVVLIVWTRIISIDLTEGQALVAHAPVWALSAGFVLGGYYLTSQQRAG
jgi:uncharacterized membrane protein YdcZ (DUF606 family)